MNEELIKRCAEEAALSDDGAYPIACGMAAIRLYHARLMTPRPISEAPTGNGSKPFLAYITGHGWAGAWKGESGRFFSSCGKMRELRQPTHFLPMPPAPFQQEDTSDPAPQQPITPEVLALVKAAKKAETYIRNWQQSPTSRRMVLGKLEKALAPFQQENADVSD